MAIKNKIVKITKNKLAEAISKGVRTMMENQVVGGSNHFTALRSIEHMATSASMEFENNLCDALGLINPDNMHPEHQTKYFQIVNTMKEGIVNSVMNAAKQLIGFPKEQDGSEGRK